ncbi:MAG: rod shape-determining protein MreD [Saccharofermentanales bacterium]
MNRIILRKIIVYFCFMAFSALIQFNYPEGLKYAGMAPDFFLIFAVLTAYLYGAYDGIAVGIIAGLLKDAYAGRALGLGALLCLYCALIASVFLKNHLSSGIFPALFQIAFASFLYFSVLILITYIIYDPSYAFLAYLNSQAIHKMLPGILLNTLAGFVFFLLFKVLSPIKKSKQILNMDYTGGEQISARM